MGVLIEREILEFLHTNEITAFEPTGIYRSTVVWEMCCINILGQTLELFVSWSCFILKLLKILKSQDHLFLAWKPKTNLNIHRKIWSHIWALSISHFLDKKATLYHLRLLNMKLIHSLLEQHTLLLTCTLFNMHFVL